MVRRLSGQVTVEEAMDLHPESIRKHLRGGHRSEAKEGTKGTRGLKRQVTRGRRPYDPNDQSSGEEKADGARTQ